MSHPAARQGRDISIALPIYWMRQADRVDVAADYLQRYLRINNVLSIPQHETRALHGGLFTPGV